MSVMKSDVVQAPSSMRQTRFARYITEALLIVVILFTGWLWRWEPGQKRPLIDFDAFYIVAQRVWLGDAERAYHFDQFSQMQMDAVGGKVALLYWTYPPQFDLLIAPLALVPLSLAYFLFMALTLGFYLVILRS